MSETMFTECGEAGFYVNQYGKKENLILVDCKNGVIYSKESIPLNNKVYLLNETYLGTVIKCIMVEKSVGNIHEITLAMIAEGVSKPVKVIDNANLYNVSLVD